jgi:hypothetical protein
MASLPAADVTRGDFWHDAGMSFQVVAGGADGRRRANAPGESDYVKKVAGDCSVRCALEDGTKLVLRPALRASWSLGPEWTLRMDACAAPAGGTAQLALVDAAGRRSKVQNLSFPVSGEWQRFTVKLRDLAGDDWDLKAVQRVELAFAGAAPQTVWFDAVRFEAESGKEIALTDVRTEHRMVEEVATRADRFQRVFVSRQAAKGWTGLATHFANLWNNRDVAATNRALLAIYGSKDPKLRADYGLEYTWHLQATPMLCRLYLNFGSRSPRRAHRLTPDVEKAILDLIWERTELKNDLHAARASTWNLTGSENHDINAKIGNVLASQIFRDHPDYAERVLPNLGRGPGSGYWFHKTDATGRYHGPEGRAQRTITGEFRSRDHYTAWVTFMKEYFRERARRGFFVEKASPGYMKYTISFIQDLYDYAADEELRRMAGMFLDLIWAEWAQDQVRGWRGGSKTREHVTLDQQQDSMFMMASYMFGGPAELNPTLASFAFSDYRPPALIWNLALNSAARVPYAYVSHQPGEERPELPRPPGMERTLLCAPESRLKRYSWVTPEFILGTRMDHPLAVHSHLSYGSVYQGIIFNTSSRAMIFPRAVEMKGTEPWKMDHEVTARSVQDGPVLITQQNRGGVTVVNPEWFPRSAQDSRPFGIYFSPDLDRLVEENGWIFAEEGNAFVAVRPVKGVYQTSVDAQSESKEWVGYQAAEQEEEPLDPASYSWSNDRTIALLKDRHSPVIFEAGRRADYATFEDFKRHIAGNVVKLSKTVVPGSYTLTYVTKGRSFDFNAANNEVPRINGASVDYFPARTFASPYINSEYGRGVVTISDGTRRLVLDFERNERH